MASPVGARRVVSREQVVLGASRFFLRHGTVDMDRLATALAISRATLYRVVHSRDGLLGDVLWLLAERLLVRARQQRRRGGDDGVLEVTQRFTDQLRGSAPFLAFLRGEPETAARVLFNATGGVHRRAVSAQREILREVHGPGAPWSPSALDQLAYLYVRIVESMIYAELLGGAPLDPDLAERAARAVLRPSG
ncbi:QsdR family transcriptional regulator [Actinokineospora sp. PR83]|uniref:QsdR family transcriptional regulator n=1 Tax=Actinokineospora sp. PR83 TaxID=2884908 RepID=UPI001EEC699B|nr:QsdR family transcriptional regulator [Actinokineospora sp. PR83]MCG8914559.1 QsdR family transcriptional regulator [Actinokineospora sp. PR83]